MATARAYTLGKLPEDQKFRGQAALIVDFLRAAPEPQTVAQQVTAIEKDLTTRQDPTRVVSFYMSVWKKKGWVKVSEVETTEAAAAADTSAEPQNDAEAGLATDAQDRVAAELEAGVEAAHAMPAADVANDAPASNEDLPAEETETESRSARRRRNRGK